MQVMLSKTLSGALAPADDEAIELLSKVKVGAIVRCEIVRMRNGQFFRKWFALLRVGFDLWCEHATMPEYMGEMVAPDFDRWRRDVTILCGFGRPVVNIKGEVRMEADSPSFASMDEDRFETLYSRTIDVLLRKVLPDGVATEESLRESVDRIMQFA